MSKTTSSNQSPCWNYSLRTLSGNLQFCPHRPVAQSADNLLQHQVGKKGKPIGATLDPSLFLHVLATESHTVQIVDHSAFDQVHNTHVFCCDSVSHVTGLRKLEGETVSKSHPQPCNLASRLAQWNSYLWVWADICENKGPIVLWTFFIGPNNSFLVESFTRYRYKRSTMMDSVDDWWEHCLVFCCVVGATRHFYQWIPNRLGSNSRKITNDNNRMCLFRSQGLLFLISCDEFNFPSIFSL